MRCPLSKWAALAALLGAYLPLAYAGTIDQDEALRLRNAGLILPLEGLLEEALSRYPGAGLLEVELEQDEDRYVYEIELLTQDGTAREIELDASTGFLLVDKEDD